MIEAVRGGDTRDDDEGDICIDDFAMSVGRCRSEQLSALFLYYDYFPPAQLHHFFPVSCTNILLKVRSSKIIHDVIALYFACIRPPKCL